MCGIAGVFHPGGQVDDLGLQRMTAALRHRGPDGQGVYRGEGIALGHRRLAVIDVEGGQQPFYAAGSRIVCVANGEIYNFRGLKRELTERGHRFRSDSDCEVIVHGYAEWGREVLDRLDGMFALAIWDRRAGRLLLARDRMGEKPLFWAALPSGALVFASELRALLRYPGMASEVDPTALSLYLHREYVPAPHSIIAGVRKLRAGHALWATSAGHGIERFWEWPLDKRLDTFEGDENALERELSRSVRERLVADVPVGVFLSGGLDSSLIAALACRERPGDIDTFGVAFAEESYDESKYARRVAGWLNARHHEVRLEASDVLGEIRRVGALLDEPLGDSSLVPTHLLCRFAREHVTVTLGGDAGDDLFCGYPTFAGEAAVGRLFEGAFRRGRWPRELFRGLSERLPLDSGYMSRGFLARQLARGAYSPLVARNQSWLASFLPEEIEALLVEPPVALDFYAAQRASDDSERTRLDRLQRFYCEGYLADDLLPKVDRASMAVSLEVRSPFLDRAVVEHAITMNPRHRHRGVQGKRILKALACRYLPRDIVFRKKHGFAMPIARWLQGPLRELCGDTLSPARLRRDGLFRPEAVDRLLAEHASGARDHRKALWTLLSFQLWRDSLSRGPSAPSS